MALTSGTRLGPYEILAAIGAGGMGEVYKATDTRLDRTVAIKVLLDDRSASPERKARFEREAKAISQLNHPHICTLYDVGSQDGVDYLVMEFIEGETLAERLKKGALPLDKALEYGIQIAGGLDKAHHAGIVHRDLKPANVMLTKPGVKLLDFGLAKILTGELGPETSDAPTKERDLTKDRAIIGTLQYMAPEQLEGRKADPRADIFGLGNILYEMVTGQRAFAGANQASLIAAILTTEPPRVSELQASSPPLLDHLIRKCLAKDPDERWRSAADLAGELEWLVGLGGRGLGQKSGPRSVPTPRPARPQNYRIEYFQSADGASIAAARGGTGTPLVVIPNMIETIETSWANYAEVFGDYELITYDRRGYGLSERDSAPHEPEPYLEDAQAVVDGYQLDEFDLLGTLLGTIEAASLASRNPDRVTRLVLRAPVTGLAHWASIPLVRAALAALEQVWEYFTESFMQFVFGWGNPKGREMAARFREITSRDELEAMFDAFIKLDLAPVYPKIRAATLIEHHPGHFFPDTYSPRIASLIRDCRMVIYSGEKKRFHDRFFDSPRISCGHRLGNGLNPETRRSQAHPEQSIMTIAVNVQDVVRELEVQDEATVYLNKNTGEFVLVTDELAGALDRAMEDLPE